MHVLIKDGAVERYPYGLTQLKSANPNTSFPSNPDDATMAEFGVHRVFFSTPPAITDSQILEESIPVFDAEAQRWTQVWQVTDMSAEQVNERNVSQASNVRLERNSKLTASDWTQVADAPVDKESWATYRQALRDITDQEGFPWSITWPTQPE